MCRVRRFIAVLLLLAYAGTGTPVCPAVMFVMAHMDGSNVVLVTHSEQGTQVRLHHAEGNFTPEVEDHASPVTRMIVSCFSRSKDGDHSLSIQALAGSLMLCDERKHEVKDTPEINVAATILLAQGLPRLVDCQEVPRAPAPVASDNHPGAQRLAMATIRLLI